MTALLTAAGSYDRRAVMTEAHRQFRLMRPLGWSFGRCLSFAWAKAREVVVGLNKAMRDRPRTRWLMMPYCSHGTRFLADHDASPTQG
jgi:hypothetical protein